MLISLESDAFADGQVTSKLWLCQVLEDPAIVPPMDPPVVWLLGGWYGMTAFLLFARESFAIDLMVSFDIDPDCEALARKLNNRWEIEGCFLTYTADVTAPDFSYATWGLPPAIVINTACEHMSAAWYAAVPAGTTVAIQGCDMDHDQHDQSITSLDDLAQRYPMATTHYRGERVFRYPDKSFSRFMVIGVK